MRARAATARNESSWHDATAITKSCSGLSSEGSPRNAGSLESSSVSGAGGADARWRRSYASYPGAVDPCHANDAVYRCTRGRSLIVRATVPGVTASADRRDASVRCVTTRPETTVIEALGRRVADDHDGEC